MFIFRYLQSSTLVRHPRMLSVYLRFIWFPNQHLVLVFPFFHRDSTSIYGGLIKRKKYSTSDSREKCNVRTNFDSKPTSTGNWCRFLWSKLWEWKLLGAEIGWKSIFVELLRDDSYHDLIFARRKINKLKLLHYSKYKVHNISTKCCFPTRKKTYTDLCIANGI